MRRSHSADYGSRLRSDSSTTRSETKWNYYPQLSGMSYHCLNAVVYVRNRVLRIGNGPERSAKHSRQFCVSRNIRETEPSLSSQITMLTMSWQILLYRFKIVTMSCRYPDKIPQDKTPQYKIYPDIIPQYKIPQDIIPQSENRDKIPHNTIFKNTFFLYLLIY